LKLGPNVAAYSRGNVGSVIMTEVW
jgi:hypothetical protein